MSNVLMMANKHLVCLMMITSKQYIVLFWSTPLFQFCIFSVSFSQDSQELLCGANDGFIYLYDRFLCQPEFISRIYSNQNKTEPTQWYFQIFTSTITSRFCSWRWRECGEFGKSDLSKVQANSFHFTDDGTKNTDYVHISDIGHFLLTLFFDPGSMTLPLKRLLSNYGEQIMLVSVWVKSYCARGLE